MRYEIRLMNNDLPGLAREVSLACCKAVDAMQARSSPFLLYRPLCRAARAVLRARVEANRWCGKACTCENTLGATELGAAAKRWQPPEPARLRVYLLVGETTPTMLVKDLLRETLRAAVATAPGAKWKGSARMIRRQIERVLRECTFQSMACGHTALCAVNEAYDPWDRAAAV